MTKPLFTILLPHLRNSSNDAALKVALDTLVTHTALDYELIIEGVEARRDIYGVLNDMARRASTDWLIPWNSDVFAAPGWAEPMWAARDAFTIVSPTMVECGAIPVNDLNLQKDFGRRPETFQRAEFEAWVQAGGGTRDDWHDGDRNWYFPSLIERDRFLSLGGFDTTRGWFPLHPLDMWFWDTWQAAGGRFKRVKAWVYHLQAYNEPERGVRDAAG